MLVWVLVLVFGIWYLVFGHLVIWCLLSTQVHFTCTPYKLQRTVFSPTPSAARFPAPASALSIQTANQNARLEFPNKKNERKIQVM